MRYQFESLFSKDFKNLIYSYVAEALKDFSFENFFNIDYIHKLQEST